MTSSMLTVVGVVGLGWLLAATIGTWAYFANQPKQSKQ
jgi:uncharacterized membrane protein SpoIIM required for sporulation